MEKCERVADRVSPFFGPLPCSARGQEAASFRTPSAPASTFETGNLTPGGPEIRGWTTSIIESGASLP